MPEYLISNTLSSFYIITVLVNCVTPYWFIGDPLNVNSSLNKRDPFEPFKSLHDLESITTQERIAQCGYPVEIHTVTTADGYILTLHRIPHGKNSGSIKRKPVLFKHGGYADSFSWLFNQPDKIFAFRLADEGYDVWFANTRGTRYSRSHTHFTNKEVNKFFDFSMDEVAKYDVPAEIDYILNTTGESKLIVIGISLGPLELHMTLSLYPEYNDKISLLTSLAPTVYLTNTHPYARWLQYTGHLLKILLDAMSGETGEYPPPWLRTWLRSRSKRMYEACTHFRIGEYICDLAFYIMSGQPAGAEKLSIMPLAASHSFEPISTKMAAHFVQLMSKEKVQHYDYGTAENLQIYGTIDPPLYYLQRTTAPVAVFYVEHDSLVIPEDVEKTVSELPNVVFYHRINARSWNHVDFVLAQDVNEVFTEPLIDLFKDY